LDATSARRSVLQPDRVVDADDGVARQYSTKLRSHSASTAMPQPRMLMSAPVMKPRRRPTFAIHSDIGIVATAEPSTYVVAPSVATALASTSEYRRGRSS
jgi:hypothetical protein